jgi:hypothetical protein
VKVFCTRKVFFFLLPVTVWIKHCRCFALLQHLHSVCVKISNCRS